MPYAAHELTAELYWSAIVETGWLDALPDDTHEAVRQAVLDAHTDNTDLACYGLTITSFDMECIEGTGPDNPNSYCSVLLQFAEASNGAFRPADIVDELDEEEGLATIAFDHDGGRYGCQVPFESDWFDPRVIELVNETMAEAGEEVQFYALPFADQIARLVLVPAKVYEKARALELIPADDYFFHG